MLTEANDLSFLGTKTSRGLGKARRLWRQKSLLWRFWVVIFFLTTCSEGQWWEGVLFSLCNRIQDSETIGYTDRKARGTRCKLYLRCAL